MELTRKTLKNEF